MSLDEFSQHKGHRDFATTVVDLDHHKLLEVINSHKKDEVIAALKAYPLAIREKVEEVSVDMWGAYTAVIQTVFPNARIVYDRYHVMQHINRELNELRQQMGAKIKGLSYLLYKHKDQFSDEQKERLKAVFKEYPCLEIAYEFKEDVRAIYEESRTVHSAMVKFQRWLRLGGMFYATSAQMIEKHLTGICNYFENHTTSGVTEGINTKIKLIKRKGYGFNNFKHFRLRLLACLGSS